MCKMNPAQMRSLFAMIALSCFAASAAFGPIGFTLEAEHYSAMQGATFDPPADKEPRIGVKHCGSGDWIRWNSVNFLNGEFDSVALHYWTGWPQDNSGAVVRLRTDAPTGAILASFDRLGRQRAIQGEPSAVITSALASVTGIHTLYLTFEGSSDICDIDRISFSGTMTAGPADAKTYYVSTIGNDGNDGLSIDRPFRTIQKAASVMKPGSRCLIRQGIYRETVCPLYTGFAGAPLSFEAYNGENVVISGADPVIGWTRHSNGILKAPMNWTLGKYNDQVLVNGKMAWVARCPNVDEAGYQPEPMGSMWCGSGVFNWTKWQRLADPVAFPTLICIGENGSHGINLPAGYEFDGDISQPASWANPTSAMMLPAALLNRPTDFFKGGLVTTHCMWWASFGEITGSRSESSAKTTFTAKLLSSSFSDLAGPGWISYLFELLDAPNEWFRKDSTLYLWPPNGVDLTAPGALVEVKRRILGFDLSNKEYVNITGIRFLAASLSLDRAAHCAIDKCHFKYVSHYDMHEWYETGVFWNSPYDPTNGRYGIWVSGNDNEIRNSSVVGSAASGIILSGYHNTVINCIIHSCNYTTGYHAGVYVFKRDITENEARGLTIGHNTIQYNSRFNVEVKAASSTPQDRVRIEYNDFGPSAYALKESASVSGQTGKVEVSHNYFHGVGCLDGGDVLPESDMGGGGWIIHHNVFWQGETPNAPLLTGSHWCLGGGDTSANGDGLLFNNTVVDSCMRGTRDRDTGLAIWYATNNTIYARSDTVPWKFTDAINRDYSLRAGSPAIDAGHDIPGWVESFKGSAPDLGAYEFGEPRWTAGADWQEQAWNYPPGNVAGVGQPFMNAGQHTLRATLIAMADRIIVKSMDPMREGSVMVFNSRGSLVLKRKIENGRSIQVPASSFGAGIYVIKLQIGVNSAVWRGMIP